MPGNDAAHRVQQTQSRPQPPLTPFIAGSGSNGGSTGRKYRASPVPAPEHQSQSNSTPPISVRGSPAMKLPKARCVT